MRDRRPRRWERQEEPDPLAGLVNLFDLWMVFSIAIMIVLAGAARRREETASEGLQSARGSRAASWDQARARPLQRFRLGRNRLQGNGERLGTAYRLPSGEVVCVPEEAPHPKAGSPIRGASEDGP